MAASVLVATAVVASGCGGPAGLRSIGAGLRGPAGAKATVYASGIPHASAFALDARGRLWVTAAGLTTHAGDGVYLVPRPGARPVKVVTGLAAPLGLVWHRGRLYVSSLGRVAELSDLRGTTFAHRRTILDGPVRGGENNNLVLAPDGRLAMGVSASCDHCTPASPWSGSIVSFRTDGSDLRLVARRVRAAYGLAFAPGTNDLYATSNQRDDLGARTPGDWLILARPGQDWRFPACYGQAGPVCRGVPSPVAVLDQHAAAGGLVLRGAVAYVAEWLSGKVLRIPLADHGRPLAHRGHPYRTGPANVVLTGIEHPLPLLALRDGSLLVGDWGSGRIYRVALP